MIEVTVNLGVAVGDMKPETFYICAYEPLPERPQRTEFYEKELPAIFDRDAQAIYDALKLSLPGGTLHRLLIKMLQGQLNLLCVPAFESPESAIQHQST